MNDGNLMPSNDTVGAPPAPHPSSLTRVYRLARKELREILRDRRTIITLIAMPVLLYPLMSVAFQQFYLASRFTRDSGTVYIAAALTSTEVTAFESRFLEGQRAARIARGEPPEPKVTLDRSKAPPTLNWWFLDGREPRTAGERAEMLERLKEELHEGKVDLIIEVPDVPRHLDPRRLAEDRFFSCRIYLLSSSSMGRAALRYIETVFAAANEQNLKDRLNLPEVKPRVMLLNVQPVVLESNAGDGMLSLAALVPLVLILMTITGAVYPAIDLTAGERERGTLEILVAAPVRRFELLSAKYISVLVVAVMTAFVNLVCMAITLRWSGLGAVLVREGLTWGLLLQVFGLLLLFAAFFSAVLLCLTSFARSFKEAQAYLIPLMLASIAPGVLALIPNLELSGVLKVLPLVNVVLLARDLFGDGTDAVTAMVVVMTTLLYALAALSLAARVFGAESVLYSEQSSWSDLMRRPEEPQPVASVPATLWCLALMVPIHFALVALVRSRELPSPVVAVFLGVGINLLLFGILPAVFAYLGHVELGTGLGITMPRATAFVAALLLGVSLWPVELWALSWIDYWTMLEQRLEPVLEQLKQAREVIGWTVLIAVIVPAILEEAFFRGLLFNALKARCGPWVTIGATSLLFGLTHIVLSPALGLERMVPSTAMGLVLGMVRWQTGSLWPSVILHVLHNALVLAVGLYVPTWGNEVPPLWIAGGFAGTGLGAYLLWIIRPPIETVAAKGD